MSAGHATLLHRPGGSPVHLAAPEVKIVAAFLTVLCVVATPRHVFWAFGGYLLLLFGVSAVAGVPARWVAKRLLIEVPFVVLALLLPFTAGGEQVAVLGLPLSVEGLLAGWNILAKGTLGLATSLLLAATTAPNDLLLGMQRLRTPQLIITISSLMLRYVELIVAEAGRMRIARISRGHDPRFLWQAGATARSVGSLFIRSYERGERVHLAMLARGWTGTMPEAQRRRPAPAWSRTRTWLLGLSPVGTSAVLLGVALWTA
ncbi:cobalt/nickel transport system permease protein [Halopolyspora algeriensis]|uniref:Cobalt/nickel transport system permease protein n=1 Tax=Halopolyspora algeriensis TaxID=1500506 RepID=A0A368VN05_9ACTN|nr:cobalt ECF transporter T component CbiQ [Halopolyspora algeriensis]RCW42864.1 cobalt/nickel transport system permease protein [Halopolyspora algeriensis]TQM56666.1 cobalt/nickel transport system permease protein [Halopolyspora algeriensis]